MDVSFPHFLFLADSLTKQTVPDTANEREKFINDARVLAEDISNNQTFATVKPLLNFWAAFSASNEVSLPIAVYGVYDCSPAMLAEEWDRYRRETKKVPFKKPYSSGLLTYFIY